MADDRELVLQLFDAFNRRDSEKIVELCSDEMEFHPVTARVTGRRAPYVGSAGLQQYLEDVSQVWEELLITARAISRRAGSIFVEGQVYLRSRERGIRDMPAAWIWDVDGDLFVRGEVFSNPQDALRRLESLVESRRSARFRNRATG